MKLSKRKVVGLPVGGLKIGDSVGATGRVVGALVGMTGAGVGRIGDPVGGGDGARVGDFVEGVVVDMDGTADTVGAIDGL
jgi:hypothetical protein